MTSNKHAIGVFFLGGARPQALTRLRQIVTCDNDSLDRQIVAWAVVHGHRHRPVDNLKYFSRCHIYALLLWDLLGCQFNNNGGEYGITIRLHSLGHRRMDQGAARLSCKFFMDDDGYRHGNSYRGKSGRSYFPDYVSTRTGSWTMDREIFSGFSQRYGSWNERLQMQRGLRSKIQIYQKMDQGYRKLVGGKIKCQINLCSWFEKRSRKLLLSTIVRIVLLKPLRSSILCVAAEMVGPLIKWKKLNLEMLSWTSLSSMANMLHSAGKILETQTSSTSNPGDFSPGFFYAWKMKRKKKEQATSNMRQGSG